MPVLHFDERQEFLTLQSTELDSTADANASAYRNASPFAHIVWDDFVDQGILRRCAAQFPDRSDKRFFDRDQERFKYQYHPRESGSILIQSLISELNSDRMLRFLSRLTGIKYLIPDPYYLGGGLHETLRGGHLSVHADFNLHKGLQARRRINLLVYLNDHWEESYGGHLELWDKKMTTCVSRVLPVMGRAVIFDTDLDSYHGQPEALKCPEGWSRKSIALYYYAVPEGGIESLKDRTTQFKARPGTSDSVDWQLKVQHLIADWAPPRLQPAIKRMVARAFSRR